MERLDKLLVDQGLAESRTQAQKLVAAGAVRAQIHGQWITLNKPAQKISTDTHLVTDTIAELRFVSRAGLKLDLAFNHLTTNGFFSEITEDSLLAGKIVLDIGQATGGFTDCALHRQATKIIGIDVGHAQLADKLRYHPQIICLEGINARHLPEQELLSYTDGGYDWVVMDVSFISQTLILPNLPKLMKSGGYLLSLVKPQFEVGKQNLGKGGIVKDESLYEQTQQKITQCAAESGLNVRTYFASAIDGGDGNREFFMFCQKP